MSKYSALRARLLELAAGVGVDADLRRSLAAHCCVFGYTAERAQTPLPRAQDFDEDLGLDVLQEARLALLMRLRMPLPAERRAELEARIGAEWPTEWSDAALTQAVALAQDVREAFRIARAPQPALVP